MTTYNPPPVGTRYPTKQSYLDARAALIAADRSQHPSTTASASTPLEARASAILAALRARDAAATSQTPHPVHGAPFELGHRFLHGVAHAPVAGSALLALARAAPKGGLLHCHFDAILPPALLLADARRRPNLCVRVDRALARPEDLADALPAFQVLSAARLREAEAGGGASCFDAERYEPGAWMPYASFVEAFPGGPEAAERWVARKVVLGEEHAYAQLQTVDGIWARFKRSFVVLRGLTGYATAWKNHFRRVLWHLARDGVSYAEIRVPMKWDFFVWQDDGEKQLSRKEMIGLLKEVLDEEGPKIRAEGLVWWGVRFIYGSFRLAEREQMRWMMDDAIELKQAYPDLLCGEYIPNGLLTMRTLTVYVRI